MVGLIKILNQYKNLKPAETADILSYFHAQTLNRREIFLAEGKRCGMAAYVESGLFRYYRVLDGVEVTRQIAFPGSFMTNLLSFARNQPNQESIQAVRKSKIYTITYQDWTYLYNKYEPFKKSWHQYIDTEFVNMQQSFYDLSAQDALQRFNNMKATNPSLIRHTPNIHISSMLGISPRHLTRLKKQSKSL